LPLEAYLSTYGYWALFVGTVLEGETFLLMAVVLAYLGYLQWLPVLSVAFCGAYFGDQLFFYLGRLGRGAFLLKRTYWRVRLARAQGLLAAHRIKLILSYRFLYGLRGAIPFAIGISGFNAGRFAALSAVSALLWLVANAAVGCLLGYIGGAYFEPVQEIMGALSIVVALVVVVFLTKRFFRRDNGAKGISE